jgi:peptide/nickel transport system substrate-binding protein
MYLAGWGSPDVVSTFNNMIHTRDPQAGFGRLNRYFYANPEMDALIAEVNAEFDEARRIELIHEINQRTLKEDVVWIPLYVESVIAGVRGDIDFEANPQEYILAFEMRSR